ncbi:Fur family transcriptional regulator [Halobacteriovorax marinus]|uniref:Fur family transcriptional regulator n=1 Tax=Halobacteriovorax marinus TaxID=97084 RepID=UPI000BDF666F|nr:Fur family transcriptional regulator [Halobacteriovorax marinus]
MNEKELKKIIKEAGLSFTKPRAAILKLLTREHGPYSADEIFEKLEEGLCDRATLFRTLKQFKEKNILNSIRFDEDFARYEFNHPGHHHHHIICKDCSKVIVLDHCFVEEIDQKIELMGYKDVEHKLEFFAICPNCQNK